jgi:hypothetical protein
MMKRFTICLSATLVIRALNEGEAAKMAQVWIDEHSLQHRQQEFRLSASGVHQATFEHDRERQQEMIWELDEQKCLEQDYFLD